MSVHFPVSLFLASKLKKKLKKQPSNYSCSQNDTKVSVKSPMVINSVIFINDILSQCTEIMRKK
jgi:hypothetical protein